MVMKCDLVAVTTLPTKWGEFSLHAFSFGDEHHLALSFGNISHAQAPLVRIHSECLTGDALFSQRCDCGSQLSSAMSRIAAEGQGLLIYLRQEGRGIGLLNKLSAYQLQDDGLDTVDANLALGLEVDARSYECCRPMLDYFGLRGIRLITNNPTKIAAIEAMGIAVQREPSESVVVAENARYLATKVDRMGHMF
jgi:GTP cyclohydrolase II